MSDPGTGAGEAERPSPEELKRALARFASGVVVLTVRDGRDDIGMTATAFASVSLTPPLVLVSVDAQSYVNEVLHRRDLWAVSLLADDQRHLAGRFAVSGRPSGRLLLASTPHHRGSRTDALVVDESLAALECRTDQLVPAGDHTLVVGEVLRVDYLSPTARPLVHWSSRYHSLGGP